MNKIKILFCSTIVFAGIALAQFEGAIDMKVTMDNEGKQQEMFYTMIVKNNLMSTNIKTGTGGVDRGKFIFRGDKQLLWIINDEEKSYFEISTKEDKELQNPDEIKNPDQIEKKPKITKTGKKETILGYSCEEIVIEDKDEVTHIWGTAKLGNLYQDLFKSFGEMGGRGSQRETKDWEDELVNMKLFPLKILSKKDDKLVQSQEVTKIEKKSVASSAFAVPKDYSKQSMDFDIQKMMKEMNNMKKNGKEENKNDPGENPDLEKMMKQMEEMMKKDNDTSDGGQ